MSRLLTFRHRLPGGSTTGVRMVVDAELRTPRTLGSIALSAASVTLIATDRFAPRSWVAGLVVGLLLAGALIGEACFGVRVIRAGQTRWPIWRSTVVRAVAVGLYAATVCTVFLTSDADPLLLGPAVVLTLGVVLMCLIPAIARRGAPAEPDT